MGTRYSQIKFGLAGLLFAILAVRTVSAVTGARTTFMSQGPGVAAAALGETFTAAGDDTSVIHYNPSLLMNLNRSELSGVHWSLFDGARYNSLGWANRGEKISFGLGAQQFARSNIEVRQNIDDIPTDASTSQILVNGSFAGRAEMPFSFNYGATLRYLSFNEFNKKASAYGVDAGFSKRLLEVDRLPRRRWVVDSGIQVQNLFSTPLRLDQEKEKIPPAVRVGLSAGSTLFPAYRKEANLLSYDFVRVGTDFQLIDGQLTNTFGGEYTVRQIIVLRAGLRENRVTAGIGFTFQDFRLDYAYLPTDIGALHKFGFIYRYGTVHEEPVRYTEEFHEVYQRAQRVAEQYERQAQDAYDDERLEDACSLLERTRPLVTNESKQPDEALSVYRKALSARRSSQLLDASQKASRAGDVVLSYQIMLDAYDIDPQQDRLENLKNIYKKAGENRKSIQKVLQTYIPKVQTRIDAAINQNDYIIAEEEIRRVTRLSLDDAATEMKAHVDDHKALYLHKLMMSADDAYKKGNNAEAFLLYTEIERVVPDQNDARARREESLARYLKKRRFSIKDGLYADKLYYLAAISFATGDDEKALDYYNQLVEFNPAQKYLPVLRESMIENGSLKRRVK